MATDPGFAEFVVDQFDDDCAVTSKRMFGEYGLYSGGTFFAVICDGRLFVKPTDAGRDYIGEVVEAPPYPGARPSLLIGDRIEDPEWLSELARITVRALEEQAARKEDAKEKRRRRR